MRKTFFSASVLFFFIGWPLLAPSTVHARVTGRCDNCHTMHNSQAGVSVTGAEPQESLLIDSCLGCHTGTNTGTNTIPYVMSDGGEPSFGTDTLAGGNFYWVKHVSDTKGHNIFLHEPDENLDQGAPGAGEQVLACGVDNCHKNLSEPFSDGVSEFVGKYGCEGCHLDVAHHADDDTAPIVDSADQGWYRFLSGHDSGAGRGVAGLEDDDWQYTKNATDHNEYLGKQAFNDEVANLSRLPGTMTGYCAGCHGIFHKQETAEGWVRHPSDAVIPNRGEYADAFGAAGSGIGTYNPDIPVARPSLDGWATPSGQVNIGTDLVMCLSCHVPHGSPYDDLLRWNYTDMVAGGGQNTKGCFACHTTKDTSGG